MSKEIKKIGNAGVAGAKAGNRLKAILKKMAIPEHKFFCTRLCPARAAADLNRVMRRLTIDIIKNNELMNIDRKIVEIIAQR